MENTSIADRGILEAFADSLRRALQHAHWSITGAVPREAVRFQPLPSNRACGFPARGLPVMLVMWHAPRCTSRYLANGAGPCPIGVVRPSVVSESRSLSTAAPLPSQHPFPDVRVDLVELRIGIPPAKVVPASPQHRIQSLYQLIHVPCRVSLHRSQLMYSCAQFFHRLRRCPPLNKMQARASLCAPSLAHRPPQKLESFRSSGYTQCLRLLRMQVQPQSFHDDPYPPVRFLRVCLRSAQ